MRFVRGKRGMAAAGEDSIIQKLQSAAADGMPAGDGLSAERVQTVLRFVQGDVDFAPMLAVASVLQVRRLDLT